MATLTTRKRARALYWQLAWTDNDGERKTKSLGKVDEVSRKKAELAKSRIELELNGESTTKSRSKKNFANYADEYLEGYRIDYPDSYDRINGMFRNYFKPEFGNLQLMQLNKFMIKAYMKKRLSGELNVKPNPPTKENINKEIRQLKALYNAAIDDELISASPIASVKGFKITESAPTDYFTMEELKILYANSAHFYYWKFLANTGLRVSEALNLRWDDVKETKIYIISTKERRTKSGKYRTVPNFAGAMAALADFPRDDDSEFIFPQIRRESFSRMASREIRGAGLHGSAHKLRHTYGTMLIQDEDIETVRDCMGHSTTSVTEKYLHSKKSTIVERNNMNI